MEPGKQQDVNPKSICGKVDGCCGKIKTAWEKGSTTETPVRHKNGLKTSLTIFFLRMPKIWVGRTRRNGEKKGDGLTRKELSEIYLLPNEVCMETFLKDFQFKILNNITCTNILLKKLGKVDSDLSPFSQVFWIYFNLF